MDTMSMQDLLVHITGITISSTGIDHIMELQEVEKR